MLALVCAAGAGHRKKLEEVARLWARGDLQKEQEHAQAEAQLDEQFAIFGLVPDAPVLPEPDPVYLWPENLQAWNLFMAVSTQWRGAGRVPEGLDYGGVEIVMRRLRVPRRLRDRRFAEVQVMERACRAVWVEQIQADEAQRTGSS